MYEETKLLSNNLKDAVFMLRHLRENQHLLTEEYIGQILKDIEDKIISKSDVMYIQWDIINVYAISESMEHSVGEIDSNAAREILQSIKNSYNAEIGVNWEVIKTHIDIYLKNRG